MLAPCGRRDVAVVLAVVIAQSRIAQLFVADSDSFGVHFYRFLRLLSLAGLAVAVAVTLLAPWGVPLLFGAGYAAATSILQIHVWSTWFVFVSSASDPWYINHDLRGLYLVKTTAAAALNVLLNLLLIPRWQGAGAALATLIAYGASAILMGAFSRHTRPLLVMQLRAMVGLPQSIYRPRTTP